MTVIDGEVTDNIVAIWQRQVAEADDLAKSQKKLSEDLEQERR